MEPNTERYEAWQMARADDDGMRQYVGPSRNKKKDAYERFNELATEIGVTRLAAVDGEFVFEPKTVYDRLVSKFKGVYPDLDLDSQEFVAYASHKLRRILNDYRDEQKGKASMDGGE